MLRAENFNAKYPIKHLGEVVDFLDNLRKPIKASDRLVGEYPYYGANGLQGFINDFIFDEPLVLLAEDGGHFGNPEKTIAYIAEGKYWVNNHAHVLKPKDGLDLKFLCRVLENYDVTPFIKGATRAKLTKGDASTIPIPFPPLTEQKRIAAILDKADSLRRKNQQAIQLADQFLRAVFLDMFGDPVANPKVWEKYAVGELGRVITGSTPPGSKDGMFGDDIPFITPGDLDSNVKQISRWLSLDGAGYSRVCRSGSLMACCIGATIGKVAMANRKSAFNQQINVVEWFDLIDDIFGYYFFKMNPRFITENAIKTTLPILKKSLFEQIEMPVPPIDMQRAFAKKVNAVWSLVDKQTRSLDLPLFDVLSQKAFAGEL
ncbi:MAG: restriction endonuclease subunit S [Methylobacter sp.]|uniref:restriction endonuclease subunit S n=1 Tax=Methylobacter sp. TaxID=2051955 RepID=UPI0025E1C974|nr:restriction endonuclease subunit S [Methylobacter sp.]MCK9622372.1 restriction endonuclease subunit S [Methylobacter sp.]